MQRRPSFVAHCIYCGHTDGLRPFINSITRARMLECVDAVACKARMASGRA